MFYGVWRVVDKCARSQRSPTPHCSSQKVGFVRYSKLLQCGRCVVIALFLSLFTSSWAQAPSSSAASNRFDQFLSEFRDAHPRSDDASYEPILDPMFQRAYARFLADEQSARLDSPESSAELIEQGDCRPGICGSDNAAHSSPPRFPAPHSLPASVSQLSDGRVAIQLRWNLRGPESGSPPGQGGGRGRPKPERYELLLIEDDTFMRFEVSDSEAFGSARRSRSSNQASNQRYKPRQQRARQSARLILDNFDGGELYIRAIYGNGRPAAVSAKLRTDDVSNHGIADSSIEGVVSSPRVSLRAPVGGGASGKSASSFGSSPLDMCISANKKESGVQSDSQLLALDCTNYGISSLQGIDTLTNLQMVVLDQNPISDISALMALSNLENVSLAETNVSSLSALSALSYLENVNVSYNPSIQSLAPLANLTSLQSITAIGTGVTNVPPFDGTALRSIVLAGSPVSDIAGLAMVETLEDVSLINTAVGDINSLIERAEAGTTVLTSVNLSGIPSIYCPQVDRLVQLLGVASFYSGGVTSPESCSSLPAPHTLNTSSNPVYSDSYTLTWAVDDLNRPGFAGDSLV